MRDTRGHGWRRTAAAAAMVLALAGLAQCAPPHGAEDAAGARLDGSSLQVLGAWSGVEQRRFTEVLAHFAAATGATLHYVSARDAGVPVVLAARIAAGDPPDVALLPQPGLLRDLVAQGRLVPLSSPAVTVVRANYPPVWRRLGSAGGRMYGVWFKAAEKSLVWYDVADFERLGVVPPSDLAGLVRVAGALTRSGRPAFAVSGREGWTLTDWFEDLYLRIAGPHRYDLLATHRLRWTDSTVVAALREMAVLLAPANVAGGTAAALRTGFEQSVVAVFGPRHVAAMLHEGDFVAGVLTSATPAKLGVDADVFALPPLHAGDAPTVVGGGDVAVALRRSAAADRLLRYLATPEAAAVWARHGGFVSPNLNLDLSVYPDPTSRSVARTLLDAGAGFRFDLSDLQPAQFGGRDDAGMALELRRFLVDRDARRTAARLEADAVAAYAGLSGKG